MDWALVSIQLNSLGKDVIGNVDHRPYYLRIHPLSLKWVHSLAFMTTCIQIVVWSPLFPSLCSLLEALSGIYISFKAWKISYSCILMSTIQLLNLNHLKYCTKKIIQHNKYSQMIIKCFILPTVKTKCHPWQYVCSSSATKYSLNSFCGLCWEK